MVPYLLWTYVMVHKLLLKCFIIEFYETYLTNTFDIIIWVESISHSFSPKFPNLFRFQFSSHSIVLINQRFNALSLFRLFLLGCKLFLRSEIIFEGKNWVCDKIIFNASYHMPHISDLRIGPLDQSPHIRNIEICNVVLEGTQSMPQHCQELNRHNDDIENQKE